MWQPTLQHLKWQSLLASNISKSLTKALMGNYQGFFIGYTFRHRCLHETQKNKKSR